MKKLIVLSLIMAGMVFMAGFSTPSPAQGPAHDEKPTFISPTPGLYVHGWPPFTVSYPKDWVELPPWPGATFEVAGPRSFYLAPPEVTDLPPSPVLTIQVFLSPLPLEDWTKELIPVWREYFTDIKVLSDKPSQLKDGAPAREVEFEFVPKYDPTGRGVKNGPKENGLLLAMKKEATWVVISLTDDREKIGEDLRRIAHSLTFQPDREKPVNVPPDVRAFLDMYCADIVSHDVKIIMAHYSDRFLLSGASKAGMEQWFRNDPSSPIQMGVISQESTVTVFEPRGNKAYVDGFWLTKIKGNANAAKVPMSGQQIINEHGQWKWFGNQR